MDDDARSVTAHTCVLRGGVLVTFDADSPAEIQIYLDPTLANQLLEQLREAAYVRN